MKITFNRQLWEAAALTFVETFLVTIGPAIAVVQVGDWNGLAGPALSSAMSAEVAAISILKSVAVRNLGEKDTIFLSGGDGDAVG